MGGFSYTAPMSSESAPTHLDIRAFAQSRQQRRGVEPLSAYARLMGETQGRGGDHPVTWSAQGELRHEGLPTAAHWLHVQVQATLPLTCQRCLDVVEVPLEVDRSFRFVADEATAEAEDDESEEDLLVASEDFDLHALVEDELILELPLIPSHVQCPAPLPGSAPDGASVVQEAPKRPSPFAVLGQLKKPPAAGS